MSIDINAFQEIPYPGQPPVATPIKNKLKFAQNYGPAVVTLDLTWATLVPPSIVETPVRIPLNINAGVRTPLDKIVSVYVDNSGNDFAVFLVFSDTQYGVSIAPNAVQWFPVVTNAFNVVFASNFIPNYSGSTRFCFCNVEIDPIEASELQAVSGLELATSPLSTDNVTVIGDYRRPRALGDRLLNRSFGLNSVAITQNILENPDPTNPDIITYISSIQLWAGTSRSLDKPARVIFNMDIVNGSAGPQIDLLGTTIAIIDNYEQKEIVTIPYANIAFSGQLDFSNLIVATNVTLKTNIAYTIRERT